MKYDSAKKKFFTCCLRQLTVLGIICFLSPMIYAEEQANVDWLLDVDAGYQQQTINKFTAELTSVILAPTLEVGGLDLSLIIPWYQKQGEFYINGIRPRLITRCEGITSLTPARQKILIERGKLTQKLLDKCNMVLDALGDLNATQSGIGDITGFARYHFPIGADSGWGTSLGLGYKSSTGDSDTGIGSGTQDALLELGVFFTRDNFSFSVDAGYDVASGDDAIADVYQTQNVAYASINMSRNFTDWFTLGVSFNGQQAYVVHGEDTKILTEYIDVKPFDALNIHLYTSQYSGDDLLPDKEIGANFTYSF